MTMDSHENGARQGTEGAPSSASAYPVAPMGVQPPFPPPPEIPDAPTDESVEGRMFDILTHPTNIPHYVAHLRGAKRSTIIWLALGIGILESVVTALLPSSGYATLDAMERLSGYHGTLLTAVVYFFLASGLYWLLAKLLGGQGTFLQSTWLYMLIWAPISAGATLLGIIPVFGLVANVVLGITQAVLTIFAMAAVHRLTVGKASVVVLIPFALWLVVAISTLVVMATTLAGSLGR